MTAGSFLLEHDRLESKRVYDFQNMTDDELRKYVYGDKGLDN